MSYASCFHRPLFRDPESGPGHLHTGLGAVVNLGVVVGLGMMVSTFQGEE